MAKRNVTISLPEELIKKAKIESAHEGKSMNAYIREAVEERLKSRSDYLAAKRRQIAQMRTGTDLGTRGEIGFTRDELHER